MWKWMLRGDEAAGSGPFCWKPATDSLASAGLRSQVGNTQAEMLNAGGKRAGWAWPRCRSHDGDDVKQRRSGRLRAKTAVNEAKTACSTAPRQGACSSLPEVCSVRVCGENHSGGTPGNTCPAAERPQIQIAGQQNANKLVSAILSLR